MADTLSPFVLWGQKSDYVTMKVELRDVTVLIFLHMYLYLITDYWQSMHVILEFRTVLSNTVLFATRPI